jgi:hypothetical protein
MALTKCPSCGGPVSTDALACPRRGQPFKPKQAGCCLGFFSVLAIGGLAIAAIAVFVAPSFLTSEQRDQLEPIGKQKAEERRREASLAKMREILPGKALHDSFQVSQVLDGGVLGHWVKDGAFPQTFGASSSPCFLYCHTNGLVDGSWISNVTYYPIGTYSYTSILGAKSTLRASTTDADAAAEYWSQNEREK